MIDRATIERIQDTAQIVEVVSDFVSLKRRGTNYVACCPFHHEKTPSFSVSPSKGIFKCFGCGKAGNAVAFVMEHEQMSYVEALKYLGKKYGIEVVDKEESPEDVQQRLYHESLLIVNEFAKDFYAKRLWESEDGQAIGLSYFRERGFTDETIRKFNLGFAPNEKRAFTHQAQRAGYKKEHLTGVGLTIEREESGELFDRFYDRVMFPWRSISGKVIAFGGRTLRSDKAIAKYINSPESEAFVKNRSLYGIYEAKAAIVKQQKCYLVEGYTDVISFHQAGIENVVASGGTSLTTGQIALIKRFSNKITVLYDGDYAGIKASLRGIDMFLEEGMEVKVALFPDGEDPDSYAKSHTAQQVLDFLNSREEDFIAFKYRLLSKDAERDPMQRARLITEIVNSISVIPDAIVRNVYVEDTALRLNVQEELLQQEVAKVRRARMEKSQFRSRMEDAGTLGSLQGAGAYVAGSTGAYGGAGRYGSAGSSNGTAVAVGGGAVLSGGGVAFNGHGSANGTNIPSFVIDTYCEEAEKEILYYLIKFGHLPLHLEEEFLYGAEESGEQRVSEYIMDQLQNDELELQNLVYKNIFNEYFGLDYADPDRIFKHFINHPDPAISKTVIDIMAQPYTITIEQFNKSLIPEKNILGRVVPKSLLVYKAKVTAQAAMNLSQELKKAQTEGNAEALQELMMQLNTLMQVRNIFAKELKRLIF
ncbi:MAG: DNA primase [Bacteroidales bacterium]|nr:DNA primase [Bacteroidales bacterium]